MAGEEVELTEEHKKKLLEDVNAFIGFIDSMEDSMEARQSGLLGRIFGRSAKEDPKNTLSQKIKDLQSNYPAGINGVDKDGITPLIYAISKGNLDVAKALIEAGANVNLPMKAGNTPLIQAIKLQNSNMVGLLVGRGADPNLARPGNLTPLELAIELENEEVIKSLVKGGADPNFVPENGVDTPFIAAVRSRNLELVKMLAPQPKEAKDSQGNIPIMIAAEMGDVAMTEYFLSQNFPLLKTFPPASPPKNQAGETALTLAAKNGHTEVVKVLVGNNKESKSGNIANPNEVGADGKTALIHAVERNNLEMVEALLNAKETLEVNASIYRENTENTIPLIVASKNGFKDIADALIKAGANVNVRDKKLQTALMHAARKGHVDIMNQIINTADQDQNKKNDLKNAVDLEGKTALIHALESPSKNAVRALISAGADVNFRGKDMTGGAETDANGNPNVKYQKHPLIVAIEKGVDAEIIDGIIAGVNAKDDNGKTTLMYAVEAGDKVTIDALYEQAKNVEGFVNAKDQDGKTALMYAVKKGDWSIIEKMINKGGHTNAQDNEDKTPLDYTTDPVLIKKLRDRGAVSAYSEVGKSQSEKKDILTRAAHKTRKRLTQFRRVVSRNLPNIIGKRNQNNPRQQ
ncbi:MAG: hypothetical protein EB127_21325 [Alphaproteobacteria bacterium]|nr:hypothetical protein [Alphaproteobacteria bacterium]